jgi:hypothetical protein
VRLAFSCFGGTRIHQDSSTGPILREECSLYVWVLNLIISPKTRIFSCVTLLKANPRILKFGFWCHRSQAARIERNTTVSSKCLELHMSSNLYRCADYLVSVCVRSG